MTDAIEDAAVAPASDIAPDAASAVYGGASAAEPAPGPSRPMARKRPLKAVWLASLAGTRMIVVALAFAFAIRVLIVEPFHIPSESMEPTLYAGDFIGATKYPYGWSYVSTSPIQLPMIPGRLFGRTAQRGDVVVFRNQLDGGVEYVKRVVGLPGDRVQMRDGVLYINGDPATLKLLRAFESLDPSGEPVRVEVFEETIPGACRHLVQHYVYPDGRAEGQDDTYEFAVPAGHYFVMGDNRDASYDSRLPGRVGFVPAGEIIGRAQFVFVSVADRRDLPSSESWLKFRPERTLKSLLCS